MQRQLSGVLRPSVAVDTVAIFLSSIGLAALCYQGLARETFGWFDEARHVMNGVFFSDLYRDFPLVSIYQYTVEYFVRFPALSFSWHPPLFAAITGLVLLVGGLEPIYVRLLV